MVVEKEGFVAFKNNYAIVLVIIVNISLRAHSTRGMFIEILLNNNGTLSNNM